MSWLDTSNKATRLILHIGIIAIIAVGIFWFCTSIFANVTENDTGLPDLPKLSKAQYIITIQATGEIMLSNDVQTTLGDKGQEVHYLYGYYIDKKNKFRYVDSVFKLDERYFGDILIEQRVK